MNSLEGLMEFKCQLSNSCLRFLLHHLRQSLIIEVTRPTASGLVFHTKIPRSEAPEPALDSFHTHDSFAIDIGHLLGSSASLDSLMEEMEQRISMSGGQMHLADLVGFSVKEVITS